MSILVTCAECRTDAKLEAVNVVVRFCEHREERAAELLFACSACGRVPVQRVPRHLAAAVVFRGAAALVTPDPTPPLEPPRPQAVPRPALCLDDLLELHFQLEDGDLVRSFLDESSPDGR